LTVRPVSVFVEDQRGVGQVEEFGDDDAGLAEAEVFRLQAGEDEVGILRLDGGGEEAGYAECVAIAEVVAVDVDGAVCAFGESLADGLAYALGAGADDDDFAAVLLLELKGLFEGVGVGLVEGILEAGLFDPLTGGVDADLRIAFGNLLDCDYDLHSKQPRAILYAQGWMCLFPRRLYAFSPAAVAPGSDSRRW